jgi:DNA-binding MarR family transcriptional regulator
MDADRSRSKQSIATDVWRMMADFAFDSFQRGHHLDVLKELGLTPGHLKVLSTLEPDAPRPMGVIAEACRCDPSMATWLVDRLEERGLVERRMLTTDRRVKTVGLTALGLQTKERLLEHIYDPPEPLLSLDRATLASLQQALRKLPARDGATTPWGRRPEVDVPRPARRSVSG